MPQVPVFGREERLNGTPLPYQKLDTNVEMFGGGQANATANIGKGLSAIADAALKINQTIEKTKGIEFSNAIEQWKQTNLLDKESGYFSKNGADAAGN